MTLFRESRLLRPASLISGVNDTKDNMRLAREAMRLWGPQAHIVT